MQQLPNILIIDDDKDLCRLIQRFFTARNYKVLEAYSGKEAFEILKTVEPDIVLCDLILEDMGGREILKQIKNIFPQLPVVMIVGYSDIRTAVELMKMGAFDYIPKPLFPDEILSVVRKGLDLKERQKNVIKAENHSIREIFISYNWKDKELARMFAKELQNKNIAVWIDEGEIKLGDSLIQKIREGIDQVKFVLALISKNSINSEWVKKELEIAINQEISNKRVKVLPIIVGDVQPPGFLLGKMYAKLNNKSSKRISDIVKQIHDRLLEEK